MRDFHLLCGHVRLPADWSTWQLYSLDECRVESLTCGDAIITSGAPNGHSGGHSVHVLYALSSVY